MAGSVPPVPGRRGGVRHPRWERGRRTTSGRTARIPSSPPKQPVTAAPGAASWGALGVAWRCHELVALCLAATWVPGAPHTRGEPRGRLPILAAPAPAHALSACRRLCCDVQTRTCWSTTSLRVHHTSCRPCADLPALAAPIHRKRAHTLQCGCADLHRGSRAFGYVLFGNVLMAAASLLAFTAHVRPLRVICPGAAVPPHACPPSAALITCPSSSPVVPMLGCSAVRSRPRRRRSTSSWSLTVDQRHWRTTCRSRCGCRRGGRDATCSDCATTEPSAAPQQDGVHWLVTHLVVRTCMTFRAAWSGRTSPCWILPGSMAHSEPR